MTNGLCSKIQPPIYLPEVSPLALPSAMHSHCLKPFDLLLYALPSYVDYATPGGSKKPSHPKPSHRHQMTKKIILNEKPVGVASRVPVYVGDMGAYSKVGINT
jgi:hypothetical protein